MAAYVRLHDMTRKRQGVPPQPRSFFKNILDCVIETGKGSIFLAEHGGETVAGAVFFHMARSVVSKFTASDMRFQSLRANNLLFWSAIQDAMSRAGFVIAQVTVLDKKQGSFKQVTSAGAVKNDLVINAYKPKKQLEENFLRRAGEGLERDFVSDLLEHLPVAPNIGRTEQMLYSKMLAHYVQRGYEIRLSARQFYTLLRDSFKLIDGYWFTDRQVLKYEEWKRKQGLAGLKEIRTGQQILFVNDERSALVWLYNFLETPQTYSDIYTAYSKNVTVSNDAIPELRELLDNNFIFEDKCYRRPKAGREKETVEAQRERDLARAFEHLLTEAGSGGKKLKGVRKEAVIFGFTRAYQEKRYYDILTVAKKLDKNILETNSELNDFVEIARLKTGEEF